MGTTGVDVLVASFRALDEAEQEEAFERVRQLRLERLAGDDSEAAQHLRSLQRVADHLGELPTSTTYREARQELVADGEEIAEINILIRFFGTWRAALEFLELTRDDSVAKVEARFAKRKLGKIWRYTDQTLSEVLHRAISEIGHACQLAEFEHWRHRELEKARAKGEELHLPSGGPYRRRYGGTWEKALLHFGYTPDEVAERLERE
jgi:hypothetical protein